MSQPGSDLKQAAQRKGSFFQTFKAVAWSFFGVRRRRDHEQEGTRVGPIHVLVAGFVGIFVLVAGLIVLVNWVAA